MTAEIWNVDVTHSALNFSVRHMMVSKVRGNFGKWTATVTMDESDPTKSKVEAEIEAASVNTDDEKRDGHLKSADFFDVEKHPKLTFKSTSVKAKDKENFTVTGDLTIKGVTKSVSLDVEFGGKLAKDPWGNERAGFAAKGHFDRKDWGLAWNMPLDAGGVVLGDKISFEIDVEAVKAKA